MEEVREHPELELVKTHLEVALGSFLNAVYRSEGWFGGYSSEIDDFFWNFIIPASSRPETDISEVKRFFEDLDRDPTLWGERKLVDQVQENLNLTDLEKEFEDSWMEFKGEAERPSDDFEYVKVSSAEEKEEFLEIFGVAFGESSEDNPYGDLPPGYIPGIRRALNGAWGTDFNENILVMKDGEAVGIGTLAAKNGIGFIYNVGTLPDEQKQGVGTAATLKILEIAEEKDIDRIILQTEYDSYVEKFYEGLGFETIFRMKGLIGLK